MIFETWATTGESVVRDLTEAELAQRELDRAADEARKAEEAEAVEAAVAAKQAILDRLGLTAEEAKMLLS